MPLIIIQNVAQLYANANANGDFVANDLAPGNNDVRVEVHGHRIFDKVISLKANDSFDLGEIHD